MEEKVLSQETIRKGIEMDDSFKVPNVGSLLENKVAVITGCSSGLGAATTKVFLEAGASVFGCFYSVADQRTYKSGAIDDVMKFANENSYKFSTINLDIANEISANTIVRNAIEEYGRIDVLCNFAGIAFFDTFDEVTREVYKRTLDVNLSSHFFLAQAVVKEMRKNILEHSYSSRGSIINMTSVTGVHFGEDGVSPYAITKSGLSALTKSLATELGPDRIRVNCISPGSILTPINFRDYNDPIRREQIEKRTSILRWGSPREVAYAALFLASDLSSYITGAEILVDGGMVNKFQLEQI